jgi:signal peptidase II
VGNLSTRRGCASSHTRPSASIANGARNAPVKKRYLLLFLIAASVVAVDQTTKQLALDGLQDGPVHLIDGVLSLDLHYNPGGAFGIFQGFPGFFLVATLLVACVLLVWAHKIEGTAHLVPVGLVLGGGLGNVYDRVFRDTGGKVVDFIDLHVWPVFNIADSSIVIGVILLLIVTARSDRDKDKAPA